MAINEIIVRETDNRRDFLTISNDFSPARMSLGGCLIVQQSLKSFSENSLRTASRRRNVGAMFSHGSNSVHNRFSGKPLSANGLIILQKRGALSKTSPGPFGLLLFRFALTLAVLIALTGCQSSEPDYVGIMNKVAATDRSEPIVLREGDIVKIAFPSKPELNSTQPIRRDGKIVVSWVEGNNGEIQAGGLTIADLQKELVNQSVSNHLSSTNLTVTVDSSTFPFYVTGAVLKPGRCISDHSITILEAVMEAGGFDYTKANLSKVTVLRQEDGRIKSITVDMKKMMNVPDTASFYLKPYDIIYVKEKIPWL